MQNETCHIELPDGRTILETAPKLAWHRTISYMDPFQRAVGHFYSLRAIACTLRHVAS